MDNTVNEVHEPVRFFPVACGSDNWNLYKELSTGTYYMFLIEEDKVGWSGCYEVSKEQAKELYSKMQTHKMKYEEAF